MSRSKYLEVLFTALEHNEPFKITLPSNHIAKIVRAGLYRARSNALARSNNNSTPFDRFVIGVKNNEVIIDPHPADTISPEELNQINPISPDELPSWGGPRKNKPT